MRKIGNARCFYGCRPKCKQAVTGIKISIADIAETYRIKYRDHGGRSRGVNRGAGSIQELYSGYIKPSGKLLRGRAVKRKPAIVAVDGYRIALVDKIGLLVKRIII